MSECFCFWNTCNSKNFYYVSSDYDNVIANEIYDMGKEIYKDLFDKMNRTKKSSYHYEPGSGSFFRNQMCFEMYQCLIKNIILELYELTGKLSDGRTIRLAALESSVDPCGDSNRFYVFNVPAENISSKNKVAKYISLFFYNDWYPGFQVISETTKRVQSPFLHDWCLIFTLYLLEKRNIYVTIDIIN